MTIISRIREDVQTVFAEDPAARTVWEVVTAYPGLHAIWLHRVAHALWRHKFFFLGRLLSHFTRWLTGIEIHPGATIGRRFFIDHGMGVVVGETAEIGDDVLMYQGVVLGGTSLEKTKRHPTIGHDVVIGTGARSVVIKPVPPGVTVVGVPAHIAGAQRVEKPQADLEHGKLPDPVLRALSETLDRQSRLEDRVRELEQTLLKFEIPAGPPAAARELSPACRALIRQALKDVIEPEVVVNIVDLGLVREIKLNGGGVEVRIALIRPECSHAASLIEQVRRRVKGVIGDEPVEVLLIGES